MTHRADYLEQEMITELREPCAVKVACTVLKGESGGNPADLLGETMTTQIPFQQQQPIFNKVGTIAELAHMTPEERIKYNISIDSFRTNLSVLKNERAEGLEEGLAKGRAEGRAEGQMLAAKNLKAMGVLTLAQISAATGLAIEEIETL